MAATNGFRRSNAFEPPPSSILAARIVGADDALELNQASFSQLLAESLGNDESGQPNLGADASVNLKVIEIVLKAGIDPFLRESVENPFRSNGALSKSETQFTTCLEVVRTAVERSPEVLFAKTSVGKREEGIQRALLTVLIPRLFSALTPASGPECIRATIDVLLTCTNHGAARFLPSDQNNIAIDLVLGCVSGRLTSSAFLVCC
jgi:hypothetical protein